MKPDLFVAFEASELSVAEVCRKLLATVEAQNGGLMEYYFADVRESDGDFVVSGERLNLRGRDDVLAKVDQSSGCEISCHLPLLSNENIYLISFEDSGQTAAMLHFSGNTRDGRLAAVIEEQSAVVGPMFEFLEAMAISLGSDFLVYGFDLAPWRALSSDVIYAGPTANFRLRRIAWRAENLSIDRLGKSWSTSLVTVGSKGFTWIRV